MDDMRAKLRGLLDDWLGGTDWSCPAEEEELDRLVGRLMEFFVSRQGEARARGLEEAAAFAETFGLLDERGQREAKKMAAGIRALAKERM